MGEFLSAFLAFPTVIFSILLVLVMVYWLFVFMGALDIEVFDFHHDTDVDLGGDAGVDLGTGAIDVHHDAGTLGSGLASILSSFGLTGVPLMISMSFLVLYAWAVCLVATLILPGSYTGTVAVLVGVGMFVVASFVALPLASVSVRPFRHIFKVHHAIRRHTLVGRTCRVTTQHVDEGFGQAEIDERGATLLVQVRCKQSYGFGKDSEVLIFDYDADDEVFFVAPFDGASAG
ncbi:MAG: hypothetical protein ACI9OJ_001086 [Myxococcota bacterium]|jgi:hypothetical protein